MGTDTASRWQQEVDGPLSELVAAAPRLSALTPAQRADLARACLDRLGANAEEWMALACAAKGLASKGPWAGEEQALGPMAAARYLRLVIGTLESAARLGRPELPGEPRVDAAGRVRVPVVPAKGLFDGVAFKGFRAEVVMQKGITRENLPDHVGGAIFSREPRVSVVLGAGNVSFIAAGDLLGQILLEGRATLVKLHPHFATLAPVWGRVFGPLVEEGYLRIVSGDAALGAAAVGDARVSRVHLTGSVATFERMVWGDDPQEAERRRDEGRPALDKEFVAELGNVTPWIVVPGPWSEKDLRFQAENLAGSIVSNGSFNCICPKVIVTARSWPQRERFLELLRGFLAAVPPRPAYYEGAIERYMELVGEPAGAAPGCLPWTLLRDSDPDSRPELFEQENFLPVTAETSLDEGDPVRFLDAASRFANERLAGTLAATVIVHPSQRKAGPVATALDSAIERLRYGTISINQFAGLAYLMFATPWGGYPGGTLVDPESGLGFSNNTFMLDGIEKTVFEGPFRISPKPIVFPSNKNALGITRALTDLYLRPSMARVPRLLVAAMRG